MKKIAACMLVCLLLVCSLMPLLVQAASVDIYDDADLFSTQDLVDIQKQLDKFHKKFPDFDLAVATIDDAGGLSAQQNAIAIYEANNDGNNGAFVLIDMDNRECYILTTGELIEYIDDHREKIFDKPDSALGGGRYGEAATIVVKEIYKYVRNATGPSPLDYGLTFGIPVVVFLIGVFFIKFRYGKHSTKATYPLAERSNLNLTHHEDTLVNVTHTTRRIETSSSSGGSGGGSSGGGGGGRSYGGDGRKF